ncbi:MAG: hypothetical protein WKG00_14185 [Polyangiaceae bacterium]
MRGGRPDGDAGGGLWQRRRRWHQRQRRRRRRVQRHSAAGPGPGGAARSVRGQRTRQRWLRSRERRQRPGGAGPGSGGAGPCEGASNVDDDGDGFDETQGDCNDCDANTNPGAVDVISVDANGDALPANQQFDEDCDGSPALPGDASCDNAAALTIDSNDAIHGANAMDICKVSQNGSWGIVSAQYVQVDLSPLPDPIGHGLLPAFGSLVSPQHGVKMLALSSGTARQPTDPGYQSVSGHDKGYTSPHPPGFPIESAACPVITGEPHDSRRCSSSSRCRRTPRACRSSSSSTPTSSRPTSAASTTTSSWRSWTRRRWTSIR